MQQEAIGNYCRKEVEYLRRAKITQTHAFFAVDGTRLTSFALSPEDCPALAVSPGDSAQ